MKINPDSMKSLVNKMKQLEEEWGKPYEASTPNEFGEISFVISSTGEVQDINIKNPKKAN